MKENWKTTNKYKNLKEELRETDEKQKVKYIEIMRWCARASLCAMFILFLGYCAFVYFSVTSLKNMHIAERHLSILITSDEDRKLHSLKATGEVPPISSSIMKSDDVTPRSIVDSQEVLFPKNLRKSQSTFMNDERKGPVKRSVDPFYPEKSDESYDDKYFDESYDDKYFDESSDESSGVSLYDFYNHLRNMMSHKFRKPISADNDDDKIRHDSFIRTTPRRDSYNNTRALNTKRNVSDIYFKNIESDKMNLISKFLQLYGLKMNDKGKVIVKRSAILPGTSDKSDLVLRHTGEQFYKFDKNYPELIRRLKTLYFKKLDNKTKDKVFAPLEEKSKLLFSIRNKSSHRNITTIHATITPSWNNMKTDTAMPPSRWRNVLRTLNDIQLYDIHDKETKINRDSSIAKRSVDSKLAPFLKFLHFLKII